MPPPIEFLSKPRRLRLYSEITTQQHVLDTHMGPMVLFRGDLILKDTATGELVPMRAADVEHLVVPLSIAAAALYDAAARRATAAPSAEVLEHAQALAEWAAGERTAGVVIANPPPEGNFLDAFMPAATQAAAVALAAAITAPYEDQRTLATVHEGGRWVDPSTSQLTEAELAALADEGGMNNNPTPRPAVDQVSEALALGDCTPGAQRGFEFDQQWDDRHEAPPAGEGEGRREAA